MVAATSSGCPTRPAGIVSSAAWAACDPLYAGVDEAWHDGVDGDVLAGQLPGQAAGEPEQVGLDGRVGRATGSGAAGVRSDGADRDEPARPRQERCGGLNGQIRPAQVDPDRLVPPRGRLV